MRTHAPPIPHACAPPHRPEPPAPLRQCAAPPRPHSSSAEPRLSWRAQLTTPPPTPSTQRASIHPHAAPKPAHFHPDLAGVAERPRHRREPPAARSPPNPLFRATSPHRTTPATFLVPRWSFSASSPPFGPAGPPPPPTARYGEHTPSHPQPRLSPQTGRAQSLRAVPPLPLAGKRHRRLLLYSWLQPGTHL